jgi:hypothetical protein
MAIILSGLSRRPCANARRAFALALLAILVASSIAFGSDSRPVPLAERIQGADVVVVATPSSVNASWRENDFGDRLIVSRYVLQVHETLKGRAAQAMSLDLDGGTLDGLTLRVSSSPTLIPGERAVFFLNGGNGAYHVHLKGQGILKLDDQDVVRGSSLTLGEIRRVAATVGN